jgi:hypothetical protein
VIERGRRLAICLLGALLTASVGCAFERVVINEGVRNLDPSNIVAGKTDHLGVIQELGLPPPSFPEEIGTRGVAKDYLRYATFESRCFRIGFEAILVATPFRWCSRLRSYELGVEFDEQGIVSGVYEMQREGVWPPFRGEDDIGEPEVRSLHGSTP